VYDLASTTPTVPLATLRDPNPGTSGFGFAVAVSGDLVVASGTESAHVFDLGSATPTVPVATLNNPSPGPNEFFGRSVAVSGNIVVAGAYQDNTGAEAAGSAYIYDLGSPTPTLPVVTLHNPTPASVDHFGFSVGISGNFVIVGAYRDGTGAPGAGSAYVYDLDSTVPTVPVFTLNNPSPDVADFFGISVGISGHRVVMGAGRDGLYDIGSAYVYDLGSATPTVPVATLDTPNPNYQVYFGSAVAVSGDRVVVGAFQDNTLNTAEGAAYVFSAATRIESWRLTNFGNIENSGAGADTSDFDHDGLINMIEFATHRDPAGFDGTVGALSRESEVLEFTYERANAAVLDGFVFVVEWSKSLEAETWSSAGVDEIVVDDDGTLQEILATIPLADVRSSFVRLRVSAP
jgi:FG-GAP repeat